MRKCSRFDVAVCGAIAALTVAVWSLALVGAGYLLGLLP